MTSGEASRPLAVCFSLESCSVRGELRCGGFKTLKERLGRDKCVSSRPKSHSSIPPFSRAFACVFLRARCKTACQTLRQKSDYKVVWRRASDIDDNERTVFIQNGGGGDKVKGGLFCRGRGGDPAPR